MNIHLRDAASPAAIAAVLAAGYTPLRPLRAVLEDQIEALIYLLDSLDPDPDLEPDDEDIGVDDERHDGEDEDAREEDDPREPSLGSLCGTATGTFLSQTNWSAGIHHDLEDEHDGREPDDEPEDGGDDESSLGAPEAVSPVSNWQIKAQNGWAAGGTDDREAGDDNGIGDMDGMEEQRGRFLPYEDREEIRAAGREAERQLGAITRRGEPSPTGSNFLLLAWYAGGARG